MRKHFLILMLMALLPLAGWAEDITANHVTVVNPYFGNLPTFTGSFANAVVVEGYYADANATTPKTPADVKAADGGTKFYVKFSATGLDGTLTQPFTVEKMPLKLYGTPGSKMYGTASDGDIFKFTGTGTKIETKYAVGTNVVELTDDLKDQIEFSRDPGDNVKTYAIHATIKSASAYKNKYVINDADILTLESTPAVAKYEITAKTFTDVAITTAPTSPATVTIEVVADLTYNGKAQKATVTVKDIAKNVTLTEAQYEADGTTPKAGTGDYYLVWATNTDAGTNTAKVTVKGMGNYAEGSISQKSFTIKHAPLWAIPVAEKEYDGTADVPAAPADLTNTKVYYDFQGFVDAKKAKDVVISTDNTLKATWASADAKKNVGEYKLNFTNADINTAFTLANYTFVAVEGTFKITQKKVKAKAADVTIAYGNPEVFTIQDDTNFDSWKDAVTGDVPALGYATKITKSAEPVASGEHKGKYVLTPSFKTAEEIDADADGAIAKAVNAAVDADNNISAADKPAAKIAQLAKAKADAKDVIANYILNEVTETTPASTYVGYLTLTKSPLQIGLKQSAYTLTKVYDGQNVSFTLDKENGVTVIGAKNNEKIDLTNLVAVIEANDSKAGLYTIRLSGVENDNYAISYIPSQFEITKRPVTLKLYDQTFVINGSAVINQNAYEVTNQDEEDCGILAADKGKVFTLAFTNAVHTTGTGANIKIDGTAHTSATTLNAALTIKPVTGTNSKWANYDFDFEGTDDNNDLEGVTPGNVRLVASGSTTVLLDDNTDISAQLKALTADVNNATVVFSPRNLNTEKWNVLVLPFDVTVKQLSTAFGYAVVDVLDEANSNGNMSFKLKVSGTIAANTPFMFYPSDEKQNLNQVVFESVKVKKTASVVTTVEKKDGANNKIIGTYKTTEIFGAGIWAMGGGAWSELSEYTSDGKLPIKPLRAYLDLTKSTAAHPMITIEEPDGNTTAIKVLNVETMETYSVDGWYTLNGVKLQGVPTQKGIYINNGKKVVVK